MVYSCFVVLCIFIFVSTSVGLLPPGESPIAVNNNNNNNNNMNATFDVVTEDSSFQHCHAVSLDYWFLAFPRSLLPLS
jgi:hypothetical protein